MNSYFKNKHAFASIFPVLFFVVSVSLVGAESPSSTQDYTVLVAAYRVQAGYLVEDSSSGVSDAGNYRKSWDAVTTLIPEPLIDAPSDEEGLALYDRAPSSFVSPYAATGPLEDFAETFSSFVLSDKPVDTSIKSRKISFFCGYPSVVGLRAKIRKRVGRL
jgi:hypothetical protein